MNTESNHRQNLVKRQSRSITLLITLLALALNFAITPAFAQSQPEAPFPTDTVPVNPDPGLASVEALPNLSSGLSALYTGWQSGKSAGELLSVAPGLEISSEHVFITLIMLDEPSAQQAIDALDELGAEVTSSFEIWIDAWVPIPELEQVAALPGVSLVREVLEVFHVDTPVDREQIESSIMEHETGASQSGGHQTQGVIASGANVWHRAGWTGQGVKVAVIDTFKWYQDAQANGELPNNIKIYSTSTNPISYYNQHGTACAEIIYDMAPGVQFTFATPYSAVSMANLIVELAQQGNKIISSSYGWVGYEPGDGTGILNNAIKYVYEMYGALYVQATGNMRQFHWDGKFTDKNNDHWHEFSPGYAINWFDPNPNTAEIDALKAETYLQSIYLRWNSWQTTSNDYDLHLVRWNAASQQAEIVNSSKNRQTGNQPPTEELSNYIVLQEGYYGIAIQRWMATGTEVLDLGGYGLPPFSINVPDRSLIDAANSPYTLSVSAVDVTTYDQENYSSQGPTHGPGGALSGGSKKPNISAFANVDTWAYSNQGTYRFNGTSAATPHVAGAAALIWQAYPGTHAYDIWMHLISFAQERGAAGPDYLYGNGVLKMWNNPPSNTSHQNPPSQCTPSCAPDVQFKIYVPIGLK